MTPRKPFSLSVLLAVVAIVVATSCGIAGYLANGIAVKLAEPENKTGNWAAFQLRKYHMLLEDSIAHYLTLQDLGASSATEVGDQVVERFDILWSRVNLLDAQETHNVMQTANADNVQLAYASFLERNAPTIDNLGVASRADIQSILTDLQTLKPQLDRFARGVLKTISDSREKLSQHARFLSKLQIVLLIGTFATMAMLTALFVFKAKQANKLAIRDPLTNLLNRRTLFENLQQEIDHAQRDGKLVAIHSLDLVRFKQINEVLGHRAGDQFLRIMGQRLRELSQNDDNAYRLGTDEFTVIQSGIVDDREVDAFVQEIRSKISKHVFVFDHEMSVDVTIGTSVSPTDGSNAEDLLKRADQALFEAKRTVAGKVLRFSSEMDQRLNRKRWIEKELTLAIERGSLALHYQPKFRLDSMELIGAEALLRWFHPQDGMISPVEFIPVAEESGLIVHLGRWVLERAIQDASHWNNMRRQSGHIAVNLSIAQFKAGDLSKEIETLFDRYSISPGQIEFEITESLLITHTESVQYALSKLRALGASVALDDFGTGYSSLSYLNQFSFDKVKIDRSFVATIQAGGTHSPIIDGIIQIARGLDMKLVAEGIENEAQLARLQKLDCQEAQGFYMGKPLPFDELCKPDKFEFLKKHALTRIEDPIVSLHS